MTASRKSWRGPNTLGPRVLRSWGRVVVPVAICVVHSPTHTLLPYVGREVSAVMPCGRRIRAGQGGTVRMTNYSVQFSLVQLLYFSHTLATDGTEFRRSYGRWFRQI